MRCSGGRWDGVGSAEYRLDGRITELGWWYLDMGYWNWKRIVIAIVVGVAVAINGLGSTTVTGPPAVAGSVIAGMVMGPLLTVAGSKLRKQIGSGKASTNS
jgi:hypothetical protein